jgi:hypothetical protein
MRSRQVPRAVTRMKILQNLGAFFCYSIPFFAIFGSFPKLFPEFLNNLGAFLCYSGSVQAFLCYFREHFIHLEAFGGLSINLKISQNVGAIF